MCTWREWDNRPLAITSRGSEILLWDKLYVCCINIIISTHLLALHIQIIIQNDLKLTLPSGRRRITKIIIKYITAISSFEGN